MGRTGTDPRQRGAWTPFVGVALAALTAGSLVVFSLVAQRTSLDGFTTRGVTAIAPSVASPPSITLPGGATAAAPESDATGTDVDGAAISLLNLSPTSALLGSDSGSLPQTAAAPDAGTDVAVAPDRTVRPTNNQLEASSPSDAERALLFRVGETTDKDKNKEARANKKGRNDKVRSGKGRDHGRAKSHNERGNSDGARRGRASHDPSPGRSTSSAPEHSSRPAPSPKPQKAAKSSAGNSHTNGKGPSKGRGRGRAND